MAPDARNVWLDLVRGLSALAVCAGHLRAGLLQDYSARTTHSFLESIFYFSTSLGHEAVMVFFVLSGFFVGGSVLRLGNTFKPVPYALTRLTRLWTVLIPALLITLAVDHVIASQAPSVLSGTYYSQWNSGPDSAYSNTFNTFFGNLYFLQTISVVPYGTNSPLWSLANEFWYYLIFPFLALTAGWCGSGTALVRTSSAICAILLLYLLPENIQMLLPVWLLGVAVYLLAQRMELKARPLALLFSLIIFSSMLVLIKLPASQHLFSGYGDYCVGLTFTPLALVLASWPGSETTRLQQALVLPAKFLANISYSLYACHFPLIVLILVCLGLPQKLAPTLTSMIQYFLLLFALIGAGGLFWLAFERNTSWIRHKLSGKNS